MFGGVSLVIAWDNLFAQKAEEANDAATVEMVARGRSFLDEELAAALRQVRAKTAERLLAEYGDDAGALVVALLHENEDGMPARLTDPFLMPVPA